MGWPRICFKQFISSKSRRIIWRFDILSYARFLHIDAENAIERTNKKFIQRFTELENKALQQGKALQDMSLEEMDAIWNFIKQQHKHL